MARQSRPNPAGIATSTVEHAHDLRDQAEPWAATAAPVVAVVRIALVAAIAAGALIDDRPSQYHPVFFVALAIAAACAGIAFALPRRRRRTLIAYAVLDLILLATLAHSSGGASSEVRFAFFAIPVLAAMLFRPRPTLIASMSVVSIYLTLVLTRQEGAVTQDQQLIYVELVYLAWVALAAVLLSRVMTRRADTIAELARVRSRLMADVLDAEDRERQRLANWLHDGAVQNLLVAGQDLSEAENGDHSALQRAHVILRDTILQLRNVLIDLHPGLLTSIGLAPALQALADAQARHASFQVTVSVDKAAEGIQDALILSLAREMLINVVKHAHATQVRVSVRRLRDGVSLEVSDDGRGFDLVRRSEAIADGHIGLASSSERVESLGGALEIESFQGQGTRVFAVIPAPARG